MAANLDLIIKAHDQASAVLNNVDKQAAGLGKTMGTVLDIREAEAARVAQAKDGGRSGRGK